MASFIDANVPMYAAGGPHPLKTWCGEVILLVAAWPQVFRTSAEVLQDLLHHYLAVRRWRQRQPIFSGFAELMRGRIERLDPANLPAWRESLSL